jgi:hypothetical protein
VPPKASPTWHEHWGVTIPRYVLHRYFNKCQKILDPANNIACLPPMRGRRYVESTVEEKRCWFHNQRDLYQQATVDFAQLQRIDYDRAFQCAGGCSGVLGFRVYGLDGTGRTGRGAGAAGWEKIGSKMDMGQQNGLGGSHVARKLPVFKADTQRFGTKRETPALFQTSGCQL